jgi:hypothetical protein
MKPHIDSDTETPIIDPCKLCECELGKGPKNCNHCNEYRYGLLFGKYGDTQEVITKSIQYHFDANYKP